MRTSRAGFTERLSAASARRPRQTLAIWGAVVVIALVLVAGLLRGLTTTASVTGSPESTQAKNVFAAAFPSVVQNRASDVIVIHSPTSQVGSAKYDTFVDRLVSDIRRAGVQSVVADPAPGSPLVSSDNHAALIQVRVNSDAAIKPVEAIVKSADGENGYSVAITGEHTVNNDFTALSSHDLEHGELAFGLPAALIVLALVFGAIVAGLIPVLMAILAIVVGLGFAAILSVEFNLSVFIVNMMTGMGLALGIDYSLFVISRFREERYAGIAQEEAIRISGATASRAVLFSGSTFVVSLFGLLLVPTTILRSLAAGAIIVGVVSVAAALTLLPAILSLLGDRVDSWRVPWVGRNLGRSDAAEAKVWRRVISAVLRRPTVSLFVAGGFMLACAVPVLGLHVGQSGVATLPATSPSKQGYLALQKYFPEANPYPVEIVAVGGNGTTQSDLTALDARLAADPRFGRGQILKSNNSDVSALVVPIRGDAVSNQAVAAVRDLRAQIIPAAFSGSGAKVLVGGQSAESADYFHAVTDPTPYVLAVVLGLSFILLTIAFRSLVISALSILLNLLSVGAAYGLLTLVFEHGFGASIFGFERVSAIDAWVPLFLFSVLFALSMDYQVFLMSRIKERYDLSGSTREAVAEGVATTARIITGAALIIVVVFAGFARGQLVMFQQMGFGVAVALLLDATVIRSVILPSSLCLLGDRAWYLPRWLEWLPKVEIEPRDASVGARPSQPPVPLAPPERAEGSEQTPRVPDLVPDRGITNQT
jgi:putative drug exporter of the RND superfamily